MSEFVDRFLRPVVEALFLVIVNGDTVARVIRTEDGAWIAVADDATLDLLPTAEHDSPAAAAADICDKLEAAINDFRFDITTWDEPEMGCTHTVTMIAHGSGRVLESFTTDDPFGAVEAAREAQVYTLEERFDMYAEMGL